MKIVKLIVAILTLLSIMLLSGCGGTSSSSKNYEGTWFSIDSKGTISKIVVEKQEKAYLVSHTDYIFNYPPDFDRGSSPEHHKALIMLCRKEKFPKQLLQIKEGTIALKESMGTGTLVFKDNKLVGKPSPEYKQELVFEKKTDKDLPNIYKTAEESIIKYLTTREKYPLKRSQLKFISEDEGDFKVSIK